MIVSIHQPNFLPWLGYFQKIAESDVHVILDNVQFEKNSFINRNRIKTVSGSMWITVPVLTKGKFGENIDNILIDSKTKWQDKIWKSISFNYGRAPFFNDYSERIKYILMRDWDNLIDLNTALFDYLLETLRLNTRIFYASKLEISEKKSDLVLGICKKLGADIYFSGSQGRGYIEEEKFRAEGIRVIYQEYRHPVYPQLFGDFIPSLSVIDLLFNKGPESLSILKSGQFEIK